MRDLVEKFSVMRDSYSTFASLTPVVSVESQMERSVLVRSYRNIRFPGQEFGVPF